jgi:hypothetical protein
MKQIQIYEKLKNREAYIIEKYADDSILVVENHNGNAVAKIVSKSIK